MASAAARRGQAVLAAGLLFGSVAPRSVAWQALPRHRSAFAVVATSATRRATGFFCRAMAIGAAKSVSFEKNSVKFKISLKKY